MKSKYLVLIACFFRGINGIVLEMECLDDSKRSCEGKENQCFEPYQQYTCPETCGACNTTCKDYKGICFNEESQCTINSNLLYECPKTCAKCDVCEDLIDSSICETRLSECALKKMKYACRKSCKYCKDACNDVGSHDFCDVHVRRGDCEKNETVKRMCRKSCELCEIEQC
ncbi:uncharacterized protein [Lepeophtheirus salmonis]|uniref:uncharacterized protein isoform X1 n=1 Tax=Lepeophtheirus salmonis TaxID=72036 RepID=UPI001AE768AF|nr:uncharacterized protein ZK643.6-like [Lepeophtheirus salmonis]